MVDVAPAVPVGVAVAVPVGVAVAAEVEGTVGVGTEGVEPGVVTSVGQAPRPPPTKVGQSPQPSRTVSGTVAGASAGPRRSSKEADDTPPVNVTSKPPAGLSGQPGTVTTAFEAGPNRRDCSPPHPAVTCTP